MADIVRLKVTGFKSFVDSVELAIPPGLTGVVGPNGCGKSNVVEALRWAMGETSAKQLRGAGMDDVIFAGATGRPARNFAEVAIGLVDPEGGFPTPWIGQPELEISRKIERGGGSTYRVNGRETRARDVQTLFADLASGARSAAIVSQGQIGAFVVAKPEQRRSILEEAAGVAGLRARRHEATLRLNAAEANLERLEDVLLGFDNQLANLQKQARQANRFRTLSDLIRAAEATAFLARWRMAESARAAAATAARQAEAAVAEAVAQSAAAERLATEATAALPAARKAEAEAAAAQQRLRLELERIDSERRRRADAKAAAQQRLDDVTRDAAREAARAEAAKAALERLNAEASALAKAAAQLADPTALDARVTALAADVAAKTKAANAAADAAAELEAAGRAARQRLDDARSRAARAQTAADAARQAFRAAEAAAPAEATVTEAAARAAEARQALDRAQAAAEAARVAAEARRRDADAANENRAETRQAHAALAAEAKTLTGLLERPGAQAHAPALDSIQVESGYETALGAALGDDLEAALDAAAPAHWSSAGAASMAALPAGARPLADFVRAPAALAPRLAQIGVVATAADGQALAANLAAGQRLVSKAGDFWRWDGFRRKAGAETAAARKLALQNRLQAVGAALIAAEADAAAAEAAAKAVRDAGADAERAEKAARDALRQVRQTVEQRAAEAARAERALAAHAAGIAAKAEAATQAATQASESAAALGDAEAAAAAVETPIAAKAKAEARRAAQNDAQLALAEARGERQRLEAARSQNAARRSAVAAETRQWQDAARDAAEALAAMQARAADANAAIAAADQGDQGEDAARAGVVDALEVAEARRRTLGDALVQAETQANERARLARAAEAAAGATREARVGAQAAAAQADAASEALQERILERIDATPGDLAGIANIDPEAPLPTLDDLDRKVERLRRERENMGAVNLRAETEIEEIASSSETIRREREDLTAAIAKLRRGVADLSSEARQRLRATFDKIDREFGLIFQRLFGGGRARLALVGSDDPLDAGLEIMASPPGKSLQTLSLLSGGERALTALALVFAAFKCNPSPICVLDEIDAPLDDSNVDRVCGLLEEMAAEGRTRFLVVTHHRMTMARMHRLYGVTMPERGVSQLVSVDYDAAQALREAV